jgi:hypothetical protein
MKTIVLLVGLVFGAWNVSLAQATPVLAASSIDPKVVTQQGTFPVEHTPKAELAAFGKSEPAVQLKEGEERKEAIPVLAPFGQEPPKK